MDENMAIFTNASSDNMNLGLTISQVTLVTVAVVLNTLYLVAVKSFNEQLNATEILQICKTVLVIIGILAYMPLETMVLIRVKDDVTTCLIKEFLEKLFIEMYPVVMMAVALTRLRVCLCMGNSAVLVTKVSAFITFGISFFLPFVSAVGMLFLYYFIAQTHDNDSRTRVNNTRSPEQTFLCDTSYYNVLTLYNEITLVIFGIIPVFLSVIMYGKIYYKVSSTKQRSISVHTRRQRIFSVMPTNPFGNVSVRDKRDTSIKLSLCLLISVFVLTWFTYIGLRFACFVQPSRSVWSALIASRLITYCMHPIGEGLFLPHKRYNLAKLMERFCLKIKSKPSSVMHSIGAITLNQGESTCVQNISVCQMLSTVKEEASVRSSIDSKLHSSLQYSQSSFPENYIDSIHDVDDIQLHKQDSSVSLHQRRTGCHPLIVSVMPTSEEMTKYEIEASATKTRTNLIYPLYLNNSSSPELMKQDGVISSPPLSTLYASPIKGKIKPCIKLPSSKSSPRHCSSCSCRNDNSPIRGHDISPNVNSNMLIALDSCKSPHFLQGCRIKKNSITPVEMNITPSSLDLSPLDSPKDRTKRNRKSTPIPPDCRSVSPRNYHRLRRLSNTSSSNRSISKSAKFSKDVCDGLTPKTQDQRTASCMRSRQSRCSCSKSSHRKEGGVRFHFPENENKHSDSNNDVVRVRHDSIKMLSRHF